MRISDWSSDVCSSDLPQQPGQHLHRPGCMPVRALRQQVLHVETEMDRGRPERAAMQHAVSNRRRRAEFLTARHPPYCSTKAFSITSWPAPVVLPSCPPITEAHTSALQSLMRISYSVSSYKKKRTTVIHTC